MIFMSIAPWVTAIITKAGWLYMNKHYPDITLDPLITSLAVALLTPMNIGIVLGFQLLEEKEQGVFRAISVTPLNNDYYLFYRFAITVVIGSIMTYFVHEILGLISLPLVFLLPVILVATCQIPLQSLMIASFARNTLEGFAVMKGTGFTLLVPLLVAYFFSDYSISWLAGIFPFFWLIKAYQFAINDQIGLFIASLSVGISYTLLLCWILFRYYRTNALK